MISRPRGLRLLITLVLLIALPVVEIWLLVWVGEVIGALPVLGLVIVEAVAGGWLMKREAGTAWRSMNDAIRAGETPTRQLADTGTVVLGGLALMFPGMITDVVGLLCLIPFTRPLPRKALTGWVNRRIARLNTLAPGAGGLFAGPGFHPGPGQRPGPGQPGYGSGGDVVPGEVVDNGQDTDATSSADKNRQDKSASDGENVIIRGELGD